MDLDNFEEFVEEKILRRGTDYYYSDAVIELSKLSPSCHVAMVESFNEPDRIYRVDVELENRKIARSKCTCPYDWGDICKHEVAVYMSLRDGKGIDLTRLKEQQKEKLQLAEKLLKNADEVDVLAFVEDYLKLDVEFRQAFINAFESL